MRSATGQGPTDIETRLDYVISGPIEIQNGDNSTNMNLNIISTHLMKIESNTVEKLHPQNLDFNVRKFWDYESLGIKVRNPPFMRIFIRT